MDLGVGFFVGVLLDEPYGDSNGIIKGVKYFEAPDKYAKFVRPNLIEIGDFPVLDLDDEIWLLQLLDKFKNCNIMNLIYRYTLLFFEYFELTHITFIIYSLLLVLGFNKRSKKYKIY